MTIELDFLGINYISVYNYIIKIYFLTITRSILCKCHSSLQHSFQHTTNTDESCGTIYLAAKSKHYTCFLMGLILADAKAVKPSNYIWIYLHPPNNPIQNIGKWVKIYIYIFYSFVRCWEITRISSPVQLILLT